MKEMEKADGEGDPHVASWALSLAAAGGSAHGHHCCLTSSHPIPLIW